MVKKDEQVEVEQTETVETVEEIAGDARFDIIDGFVLENPDKLERVIHGEMKSRGYPEGGLIQEYETLEKIPKELVLARYDKLAGYITKGIGGDQRVKVKTGSFWDFKNKRPHKTPQVLYIFRVGGGNIELSDPSKLASAVMTIQSATDEKAKKSEERKARARRKSLIKGE